ncbi:MAG: SDR family NAD(P)-dependent oxidoreductase [Rhodothermales bacterium]
MDLGLKNKVAVVTGSSRGIGKYIAARLAEEGCSVTVCARSTDDLEETAAELRDGGADVLALETDLTRAEAPQELIDATVDRFGRLDILVNNVGGNRRKPFVETTDEDWADILDLNFNSHIRCSRAAIPFMREAGSGAIVFISSIFGREAGGPGLSIYNTTKSALISVSKIMALELAPENIRVNSVAPGSIRFPGGSWDRRVREQPDEMKAFVEQHLPIGRFGKAEEVADVVAFLVSQRASLVTGACLNVVGGQSHSLI